MENPTSDEKALAALAHASVVLSYFGPIGAAHVWVVQRGKSKYVRYHALQAMGYQVLIFWAWLIGGVLIGMGVVGVSVATGILSSDPSVLAPEAMFFIQPVIMLLVFGMGGLMFLAGFVGAVFCLVGKDFRYPILGSWLHRRVFNGQNTEEEIEKWEEYWVGGVCHATAILQVWSMITPLIVWFSQKERSARLEFQALQAGVYQLAATMAYLLSNAGLFVVYLVFIAVLVTSGVSTDPTQEVSPGFGVLLVIIVAAFVLVILGTMVLYPVYLILAGVAAARTMRGHDFKYPLLGRIIQNRLSRRKRENG